MRPERAPTQYGPPTKIRDLKNKKVKELHVPNHIKHMLQRCVASLPFSLSNSLFFSLFFTLSISLAVSRALHLIHSVTDGQNLRCFSRYAVDITGHGNARMTAHPLPAAK